jgi:hypothetical protein
MDLEKFEMRYCKKYQMLGVGVGENGAILTRLRCKQWDCAYCAYVNRVQWHMRIMRTLPHLDTPLAFITVTIKPRKNERDYGLARIRGGLNRLQKRMRRANMFDEMPYVRTYERQKNGNWHAHALIGWANYWYGMRYAGKRIETPDQLNKANKRWLKDNAASCGLGHQADYRILQDIDDMVSADTICDDEQIDDMVSADTICDDEQMEAVSRITSYVTKYMSKDLMNEVDRLRPPRMRVIQASKHFAKSRAADLEELCFELMRTYTMENHIALGPDAKVRDIQRGEEVRSEDFVHIANTDWDNRNLVYPDEKYVDIFED